jgi:hypothetical protein
MMRFSFAVLERLEEEVEKVQERARKVAAILDQHGIPYQIIGGIAVYSWIVMTDPIAARNTQDVDISVRREDLPRVQAALAEAGYRYNETLGVKMLLEPGVQRARDAIHIVIAGEKVRPEYAHAAPLIPDEPPRPSGEYAVIDLPPLVRMKLTSFRRKDQVHLLDLLGVGLITREIESSLPLDLMSRLQELKDNPDG